MLLRSQPHRRHKPSQFHWRYQPTTKHVIARLPHPAKRQSSMMLKAQAHTRMPLAAKNVTFLGILNELRLNLAKQYRLSAAGLRKYDGRSAMKRQVALVMPFDAGWILIS